MTETNVPRYFFDIVDGERQMRDEEGLVLADQEAARYQAIASLVDFAREELPDGDHRSFVVKVRNSGDRCLLTARLSLDADWLERGT